MRFKTESKDCNVYEAKTTVRCIISEPKYYLQVKFSQTSILAKYHFPMCMKYIVHVHVADKNYIM